MKWEKFPDFNKNNTFMCQKLIIQNYEFNLCKIIEIPHIEIYLILFKF